MKRDFIVKDLTSPCFKISHPDHGEHMFFGSLSALKNSDMEDFYKLHPVIDIVTFTLLLNSVILL